MRLGHGDVIRIVFNKSRPLMSKNTGLAKVDRYRQGHIDSYMPLISVKF